MPVLVAMVPKKATIKQTSQMKNNKKQSPQNSSSGLKLPKSKKELFDKSSFFCLFNRSKWSEEHIIILDIDIDNIVESIWCISNIPNSEDDMIT